MRDQDVPQLWPEEAFGLGWGLAGPPAVDPIPRSIHARRLHDVIHGPVLLYQWEIMAQSWPE